MRVTKPSLKDLAQVSVMIICSDTESKGSGTIVCVDDILYVLTAYHVIENCAKESISVSAEKDKKIYTFKCKKIVHPDPDKDCAVLQVSNDDSYPEGPLRRVRILKQVPNGEGVLCGFDKDRQEVKVYPFNQVGENKWALHYFDVSSQPITAKENWGGFSGGGVFYKGEKGELFLTYYMKGLKNIEGNNNEFVCYPATYFTGYNTLRKILLNDQIEIEYVSDDGMMDLGNHEVDKSLPHFLTSPPMIANATNVIGREKDLHALWDALNENKAVILTGFGGIGKTKLAQLLFHEYENRFDEVAWINYKSNLIKSFLACLNVPQFQGKNYQDEKERWEAVESTLTNDDKKKLFIIDNVDNDVKQYPMQDEKLLELINWKDTTIMLTSRLTRLEDYYLFSLGSLNNEDCVKVFNHYYRGESPATQKIVDIIELANRHTLTIELLAKGAWQEDFDEYFEKVKRGFDKVDGLMSTKHHKGEDTIVGHLQFLFNMQKRKWMDKKVLYSFAILPVNCECTKEELEHWFGFKKNDWSAVMQDGWLTYDEKRRKYYLHPLVRTIVRFDFNGVKAPKGTADNILDYFENHDELFRIDKGFVSLQRMIGILESVMHAIVQEETGRIATLNNYLGFSYYEIGNYDKALKYFSKALAIRKKVFGKEHSSTATSFHNIGLVHREKGDYDKALKYFSKALAIREKVLGEEHPDTAMSNNNIGVVYLRQSNYDKALKYFSKALATRKKVLGEKHPDTAMSYNNIGVVNVILGNHDIGLNYYFKALKIRKEVFGMEHRDTAQSYNNIGIVFRKQGEYDKALKKFFFKALKIRKKVLGIVHPDTATSYNEIGVVYREQGDCDKALCYLSKALEIRKMVLGKEHPAIAASFHNLGMVYREQREYDQALKYFFEALTIREKVLGEEHSDTATTYYEIGVVYREQGDFDKALEYFEKTNLIYEKVFGPKHQHTNNT